MKSCAVAGSTPRRRVRREYECMRAEQPPGDPLLGHLVGGAWRVAALEREPFLFEHREPGLHPRRRERRGRGQRVDGGDAGDLEVAAQHGGDGVLVAGDRGVGRRRASPPRTTTRFPSSPRRGGGRRARRRAAASRGEEPRARATPSTSCRSSAVVGSGVISSCTCVIASGSSEPIDARSTDSPRRSCTALVRRFWNSSSSRNA